MARPTRDSEKELSKNFAKQNWKKQIRWLEFFFFFMCNAAGNALVHQTIQAGYYWPCMFKDAHQYAKICHTCQITAGKQRSSAMPLQPVLETKPFVKWGLDFIGVVNPNSSAGHKFILTATDYCTRWTEALACKNEIAEVVIRFIEEYIVIRFRMPYPLVCDNGQAFIATSLSEWAYDHQVIINFSSNYYPQGNGVVESTNKNLLTGIKKFLDQNPRDWHSKLKYAF